MMRTTKPLVPKSTDGDAACTGSADPVSTSMATPMMPADAMTRRTERNDTT
jgi:hypothetical protein